MNRRTVADLRKGRFCVFCGSKPSGKKTNEHILPQWLSKLTSAGAVEAGLILDSTARDFGRVRTIGAQSFSFPACESCNHRYSSLERRVRKIVESLLSMKGRYEYYEVDDLMDWMDKIRIGVWLAEHYMKRDLFRYNPHMYINDRVGVKDRVLGVIITDGFWSGFNYVESQSPVFLIFPCALALRIANIVLVSISYDFMVAENAGLPFPVVCQVGEPGLITYLGRLRHPPRNPLYTAELLNYGAWFAQSIYPSANVHPDWAAVPDTLDPRLRLAPGSQKLNPIIFSRNDHEWMIQRNHSLAFEVLRVGPRREDMVRFLYQLKLTLMKEQLKAHSAYHVYSPFVTKQYLRSLYRHYRTSIWQRGRMRSLRKAHNFR